MHLTQRRRHFPNSAAAVAELRRELLHQVAVRTLRFGTDQRLEAVPEGDVAARAVLLHLQRAAHVFVVTGVAV